MELGWMVAIDFFTNFVWFLKIKVWGLFIFDSFFNQRVNPKDFKSCSKKLKILILILAWVLALNVFL